MSRSRRVDPKHFGKIRLALKRNEFLSQHDLAIDLGLGKDTVTKFFNGKPIDRKNFEEICFRLGLDANEIAVPLNEINETPSEIIENTPTINNQSTAALFHFDWGEAPDISVFYGRVQECETLQQWVMQDRCRLVAIFGMGGMGKTSLAARLAKQIQGEFEYVIWRSLLNAPSITEILQEIIQFLSNQQQLDQSEPVDRKVSRLLGYLRQHRCLLVLDNWESVLQGGAVSGQYTPGYEDYGYLLSRIGETEHQSCLIITSREKAKEVVLLEGIPAVQSLFLKGLSLEEGKSIFKAQNCFGIDDAEWQKVLDHYAGNPLALNITAAGIRELADGDMTELLPYLRAGYLQFSDINHVIDRQFFRLSDVEQQVMYWLAINREPVSLAELETDIVSRAVKRDLLEALKSLGRRGLLERSQKKWLLQPVVIEYVTQRFTKRVTEEILRQKLDLMRDYALMKAQSRDFIRQAQIRLVLHPILDKLADELGSDQKTEQHLKDLLTVLRQTTPRQTGYVAGNILNLLHELNADLSDLDFSNLTVWQAYLCTAKLHYVDFSGADLSQSVFAGALSATLAVAFSPDGALFASGNSDGVIRLWHTANGQKHLILKGHSSWVTSIAFSPDGQFLASGGFDFTVKLWNVSTGECVNTFTGHQNWVWSVRFSPNGQWLASASVDRTIRLWDMTTQTHNKTLEGHTGTIWYASFSPDSQWLASGSDDRMVRLWNVQTGETTQIFEGHQGRVRAVLFTPDQQLLISTGMDQTIKFWQITTGECLKTLRGHTSQIPCLAISADGQLLASGEQNSTVRVWDVASGHCLKILQGHPNGVWSVAFHPDNETLISGSNDSMVKLWNARTGQSLRTLQGYNDGVRALAFSPDGQLLVSGGNDKLIKLWDVESGDRVGTLSGHTSWIWGVAFSPNGQWLASASSDCTVRIWHVRTSQMFQVLKGHTTLVMTVAFGADNQTVVSGCSDQTIKFWNIHSGTCLRTLSCHAQIWSVALSPVIPSRNDIENELSQILASGADDTLVNLWHFPSGRHLKTLEGHTSAVWCLAFSPDGKLLASGCHDQTIRLWNVESGECLRVLSCTDRIWSVSFSADGRLLASSSGDKTVCLWDVASGEHLGELRNHQSEVHAVTFACDRPFVASSGQDGIINIWNAQAQTLVHSLRDQRPYEQMNITGVTGITEAEKETLKALGAIEM